MLDERWHAGTYGIPDAGTMRPCACRVRWEGMLTDPVYEGKSMAAMIDLVAGGEIASGSHVFVRPPGWRPVLSAYASLFK